MGANKQKTLDFFILKKPSVKKALESEEHPRKAQKRLRENATKRNTRLQYLLQTSF